jgi:hypothetical protein
MGIKTRYLQLSDTTMMEYCLHSESSTVPSSSSNNSAYIYTKLKNGHYAIFYPLSYELEADTINIGKVKKLSEENIKSINTILHLAVPISSDENEWYTFLDPDYKYINNDDKLLNDFTASTGNYEIIRQYEKYCLPASESNIFTYNQLTSQIGYDSLKLYFTTGYDFSDTYAAMIRVSVKRTDDTYLDLCNLLYLKSNVYKYVTYMSSPIIFGNFIYDKYLEIKLPCISDIIKNTEFNSILKISEGSPIKLLFSYIGNNDKRLSCIEYTTSELINAENKIADNVNCNFSLTSSIKGAIPVNNLASDNLGVYIADCNNKPYIEFYGTWKNAPLTASIILRFNNEIPLYDKSLIHKSSFTYEVDADYNASNVNRLKKWVAIHEIQADLIDINNTIVKTETYSLSQSFVNSNDTKFYYRPIFFNDDIKTKIINQEVSLRLVYTMRFINIEDSVQFTKSGSISLSGNTLYKFCDATTTLNFSDRLPYKVYNKIIESKQQLSGGISTSPQVKYVKTFYNATDVVLESNSTTYENTGYTLTISQAPKSYKFIFKIKDTNGNYKFMDLTDTYYKLYGKDSNQNDIIIEPTYSSNMNMVLGELEFNFSASVISKLKAVDDDKRILSIVAYNTDNSVSSMYDFYYTF